LDELHRLMTHFAEMQKRRPASNPVHVIIAFAIFSTRRLEEITRISWTDLDLDGKRILERDMKNPGERIGSDVWCDLPDPAVRVIKSRQKGAYDQIFPYNGDAIGAAFTRSHKAI
jgi:hypothetical protein